MKFGLANAIEAATAALAQAGLEAIAFAPAGTVSEFFAVLATGGLVLEAPVIIGVGAVIGVSVLLASPALQLLVRHECKGACGCMDSKPA